MGEIQVSKYSQARLKRAVDAYVENMTATGYPSEFYIDSVRADTLSGWTGRIHQAIGRMKYRKQHRYLGPKGFIDEKGQVRSPEEWRAWFNRR